MLVVESLERARRRGARILARIGSYAFSCDGEHISLANGTGALRCMEDALARARLSAGEIEYVNAHATGTPQGDAVEARALARLFGGKNVPVSSTKGMMGHSLGAAGAIEAVFCLLALRHQLLPPNINFRGGDAGLDLNIVANDAKTGSLRTVLSNSFGFGGTNASIIMQSVAA